MSEINAKPAEKKSHQMHLPSETHIRSKIVSSNLRLPLEGRIDLTYRCNNSCRHCWLWEPDTAAVKKEELSFNQIRNIVDQARALGCRSWGISGGEPMLREDFSEVFDYITCNSATYNIATNGTLITPTIAKLLTRKGAKLVSLYGASAKVYDHVTRNPGGFEKAIQGMNYLKEAGVSFFILMVPMKDNWHQWEDMVALASKLTPYTRIGAPWFYQTHTGTDLQKSQIASQRLDPHDLVAVTRPYPRQVEQFSHQKPQVERACSKITPENNRFFASCITNRKEFHIDPYGKMSWCMYIKDPDLRFDLRRGSFEEAWERFIPSCTDKICGEREWHENCASCELREHCSWCAAYAYLETGRYSAPIKYLCDVAKETRAFRQDWQDKHHRYFQIAGITVQLESDIDFNQIRFKDELKAFAVDGPGEDNVFLRHNFKIPEQKNKDLGKVVYDKPPWLISRANGSWFYRTVGAGLHKKPGFNSPIAVFNAEHSRANIYNSPGRKRAVEKFGWGSLTLFPTDQIWLAPLLARRDAILLHAAAAVVNDQGLIFVGHSDAGKSTTMEMLKAAQLRNVVRAEILCDDRNIIRRWFGEWKVHGTWSHGTTADVSASSAPLKAVLFLEHANENKLEAITDRKLIWQRLLATLIRATVTAEWWQKELDILEQIVYQIPCYRMKFDKSGDIVPQMKELVENCGTEKEQI